MSLPSHFQSEIDALVQDIAKASPKDLLQHCANYFHHRLATERSTHVSGSQPTTKMADTAGPFGERSPFGGAGKSANTIEEEDEEHDSFGGSPTTNFSRGAGGASPFSTSSPFGAAAGGAAAGAAGGSLFGTWGGVSEDQDAAAKTTPSNYAPGRRTSVSAESMQPDSGSSNWKPPNHPKTPDQLSRLKTAVAGNFLFSHLDEDSFGTVLGALVEKAIPAANIKVISQGDEGDYFYVIEQGDFAIYINPAGSLQPGPDGMGNKVVTIGPGGSFGELALMYNAPRAATVVSASGGGMLWALDRVTFRRILMDSAFQKRKMYEGFLEEVELLQSLKPYERAKIADALESVKFSAGDSIIREGEPGDNFYLLEAGEASAYKSGIEKPVKEYTRGSYFGELALLDDKPRAASVVAKTDLKVAKLGRDGFKRLLGPVEGLMRRTDYDAGENLDPLTKQTTVT